MWLAAVWLPGSAGFMRWEDGCFIVAAFVIGALVGSFLNVVGYRVPAGRSVVRGRSACPACGQHVRARDNIPVLGWLMLRGRCRDCRSPIPATYPLVEAGCGAALAAIALADMLAWRSTGSFLPLLDRVLAIGDWRWLLGWVARAGAVLTLIAWSLLARRGHLVAWRTACAAAMVVAVVLAATAHSPWWGAARALVGAGVGWAAGGLAGASFARRPLMLVGAAGGPQAVVVTMALVLTAASLRMRLPSPRKESQPDGQGRVPGDLAVAAVASLVAVGVVEPALVQWFRALPGR